MPNSMISVPKLSSEYLAEANESLRRLLQDIFSDGYLQGYAKGDGDAINRILKAARAPTTGQTAPATAVRPPPQTNGSAERSSETRDLIDAVLGQIGTTGATPKMVFESPLNVAGIRRQAIAKVIRRWTVNGRYKNKGKGHYCMAPK